MATGFSFKTFPMAALREYGKEVIEATQQTGMHSQKM